MLNILAPSMILSSHCFSSAPLLIFKSLPCQLYKYHGEGEKQKHLFEGLKHPRIHKSFRRAISWNQTCSGRRSGYPLAMRIGILARNFGRVTVYIGGIFGDPRFWRPPMMCASHQCASQQEASSNLRIPKKGRAHCQ